MVIDMKYFFQMGIIAAVSAAAELLHVLLPFSIPASVYGLVLLFVLLMTGVVKLSQIEETADFLLLIMPALFIEPSVKLMTAFGIIRGRTLRMLLLCAVSTCVTIAVTGVTAQAVIRLRGRKQDRSGKLCTQEEGGNHGAE